MQESSDPPSKCNADDNGDCSKSQSRKGVHAGRTVPEKARDTTQSPRQGRSHQGQHDRRHNANAGGGPTPATACITRKGRLEIP